MPDSSELPPIIDSLPAPKVEAATAPADKQPPPGIVHVMAWMAGSAFILSAYHLMGIDSQSPARWVVIGYQSLLAMIQGIATASVGMWAWRRARGGVRFPVAPGHYLLCITGCISLLQGTLIIFWLLTSKALGYEDPNNLGYMAINSISQFMQAGLFVYAAVSISGSRHWGLALLALAGSAWLSMLLSLAFMLVFTSELWHLFSILSYLDKVPGSLALAAVGIACVIDLKRSLQRDWLHWLGALIIVASVAVYWGFQLAMWLVTAV